MLKQGGVMIELKVVENIQHDEVSAIVVPASEAQRTSLGQAAVGQAWMAWDYADSFPKVVKFMPPSAPQDDDDNERALRSYRFALKVADRHEMSSIAVPLPEHAGITESSELLEVGMGKLITDQCHTLKYLRRLVLLAKNEQEAGRYAKLAG